MRSEIKHRNGFTLAELLISLAILGVIAVFTIPKILTGQQNGQYNSIAKETAATVSAAYTLYKLDNGPSASAKFADLTPYMNYVKYDTALTIDDKYTLTSLSCSTGCLKLHNGSVVSYSNDDFSATNPTNAIEFYVDPNGTYSNTTNGPDKSVQFFIYYNGRLTTRGTSDPNTVAAGVTYASADPTYDPPWFKW